MDCRTRTGYVGRLPGGAADRLALCQPFESALAEFREPRILPMGGLCLLVSRPAAFVSALPMVRRGEAAPEGLAPELFVVALLRSTQPYNFLEAKSLNFTS